MLAQSIRACCCRSFAINKKLQQNWCESAACVNKPKNRRRVKNKGTETKNHQPTNMRCVFFKMWLLRYGLRGFLFIYRLELEYFQKLISTRKKFGAPPLGLAKSIYHIYLSFFSKPLIIGYSFCLSLFSA